MRIAAWATTGALLSAGVLGGCAQVAPRPTVSPNPFGYLKRSAVCSTGPINTTAAGLLVAIKTRSDDGLCSVGLSEPKGGAYASFLLSTLPMHGNSFIYNYDDHTIVNYTAATAYAGTDSFTVSLIPTARGPRVPLTVDVAVDATGVKPPPPPPPPTPAPAAKPKPRHLRHYHHVATKHG